jgi:hypothetical protein
MAEKFANAASSTLNGGIDAADLTATVTDASSFPATGNFRIRIDDEICIVTAVSGADFTITRGAESTSAVSHASGSTVDHILTAGALNALLAERHGSGPYVSRPAAGVAGRLYFPTDNMYIYRDNGATWDAWGARTMFTIPPTTGWTAINGATGTSYNNYYAIDDTTGAAAIDLKILVRGVTAPYVLTTGYIPQIFFDGGNTNVRAGICWRESASGKLHLIGNRALYSSAHWLRQEYAADETSSPADIATYAVPSRYTPFPHGIVWVRLEDDSMDRKVSYSYDGGFSWLEIMSFTRTHELTPDQVGFYVDCQDETPGGSIILTSWAVT